MRSRYQFEPGGKARILRADHPAVVEGRTLMRSRVRSARHLDRILIPGEMNAKIGGMWERGPWPGTRIFTLSLEERATCPRECRQWRSCYGNHQRFTIRVRNDRYLIPRLEAEIPILAARFERFSVRLHQLGDFYSVLYTRFWLDQVQRWPGLHCFGFTARPRGSEIGKLIEQAGWDRFRIRFSNDPGLRSTSVMEEPPEKHPDGAINCLAQTGEAKKCEDCGVCLTTSKRVVFALH
jgi:hypothetical protein